MKYLNGQSLSRRAAVAGAALALLGVSACGGDDSSSSSSSAATGDSSASLSEAKDLAGKYVARPSEIPVSAPISKAIPEGKKTEFISCGSPVCAAEADIFKEAAGHLGWSVVTRDTDGSPESVKAAFHEAIRDKPDGVAYCVINGSLIANELEQLKKDGAFITACASIDPAGKYGIDFVTDTPAQLGEEGKAMAAWVVNDSAGKANTVWVNLPDLPILSDLRNQFIDEHKRLCPSCPVDTIDLPLTALAQGQAPNRIVAYLRSHPDVKYVALSTDALGAGLPAALSGAGLNDVKYLGQSASETTIQNVISGKEAVTGLFPMYEIMYSMADAMARNFSGTPLEEDVAPPVWLVDQKTVPQDDLYYPLVEGGVDQFLKLWGKS